MIGMVVKEVKNQKLKCKMIPITRDKKNDLTIIHFGF